jgi:hypothetical protein
MFTWGYCLACNELFSGLISPSLPPFPSLSLFDWDVSAVVGEGKQDEMIND